MGEERPTRILHVECSNATIALRGTGALPAGAAIPFRHLAPDFVRGAPAFEYVYMKQLGHHARTGSELVRYSAQHKHVATIGVAGEDESGG